MTEEVISITPDRQVLTFKNLQSAKAILMKQYHQFIITDELDLAEKMCFEELILWYKSFGLKIREFSRTERTNQIPQGMRISHIHAARYMWPIFIMQGRKTIEKIKEGKKLTPSNAKYYYCLYEPGVDPVLDKLYTQQTPQAMLIINLFVEHVPRSGLPEHRVWKLMGDFTKQIQPYRREGQKMDAWGVFKYYRKRLINLGFINWK